MAAVNKIIINGAVKIDLSGDTVTSELLADGATAHDKSGQPITGALKPGITPTGTLEITTDGVYDVTQYASVSVSVGGSTIQQRLQD